MHLSDWGGFVEQRKITLFDIWIMTDEKKLACFLPFIAENKARSHYKIIFIIHS